MLVAIIEGVCYAVYYSFRILFKAFKGAYLLAGFLVAGFRSCVSHARQQQAE